MRTRLTILFGILCLSALGASTVTAQEIPTPEDLCNTENPPEECLNQGDLEATVNEEVQSTAEGLPLESPCGDDCGGVGEGGGGGGGTPNPWGCTGWSDNPHESTISPGRGWIQAKSHISCTGYPPSGALWKIEQILRRSSWRGWIQVAPSSGWKVSKCPSGTGGPKCTARTMIAYINWNCPTDTLYNYEVASYHEIDYGGIQYSVRDVNETGPWNSSGDERILCHANS